MKSDRLSGGLLHLANSDFTQALSSFKKSPTAQNAENLYGHAVSRLGVLLVKLSRTKAASINELLSAKQNKTSEASARPTAKIKEEISAIKSLFESAQNAMKPNSISGIEYALNILIPNLLTDNVRQDKYFSSELIKFQLLYSTRLSVIDDLARVRASGRSYLSRLFAPGLGKKIKSILDENRDAIFLSQEQIKEFYKLVLTYQYNEKYDRVIGNLEKRLFLYDVLENKEYEYIKLWKKNKTDINIDKLILLRRIYNETGLKAYVVIIEELNNNNLLSDRIFASFNALVFQSQDFFDNLKLIADTITRNKLTNKNNLLVILFACALDNMPHPNVSDFQFDKYMTYIIERYIQSGDKIDIEKICLFLDLLAALTRNKGKISLDKLCDLMSEVEDAMGTENFIVLCKKILTYKMSYTDFITVMNMALQLRKESLGNLFQLIDRHHDDLETLRYEMTDVIVKDYQLKYPEKPLDEVIHDFLNVSDDVEFPIGADELEQIKDRYLRIKSMSEKFITFGTRGLQSELEKCQKQLRQNPENVEAQLTLLAIIRLHVKDKLGTNPYNLQMLNVLALLNQPKRIAQIKTGEGKSTLIAVLAAYLGLMNHKVDIITTSHDLAIRDAKKFEPFYLSLGLEVDNNVGEDKDNNCYKSAIVYGTVSDFEFAYLRGETQEGSPGRGNRTYDAVIADEVDSMFIDMQRNEAILSRPSDNTYEADVYHDIWEWISSTREHEQTEKNLQAMLKSTGVNITPELAKTWLKSARNALLYSEDNEYIIDYPEKKSRKYKSGVDERVIKIVNKSHTGEVQSESTRWQGGLHEILEAKHNLQVHVETLTSASVNHIEYFNKYKILIGLTGTLGSTACRDELRQLYKVTTYDSPPYKPSLKKHIPDIIAADEKEQRQCICESVKKEVDAGRPYLVLCESIQETNTLFELLSKKVPSTQIYNGVQTDSAEAILGLGGNPGAAIIATNVAGRGAHIETTPVAEENGGMQVSLTFPAINERVEEQAFGRTGRQGKRGTYNYILRENQLSATENAAKTVPEKIAAMKATRERREKYTSTRNLFNYNLMHKLFILQTLVFALPMNIKLSIMTEWSKFKTKTQKYASRYMRDELDDSCEDEVIAKIMADFNDFWKAALKKHPGNYKSPMNFIKSQIKQESLDKYAKKILMEAYLLLENPDFDFANDLVDMLVELKISELENIKESAYSPQRLLQFYRTKVSTSRPVEEKSERSGLNVASLLKSLF